ncbi:hypothetical protein [Massilia cavernae]|uniref:Uncharacterized protein n=1 Tax=Massilia cavernae TaxID=2320864 RepID=A0A418Y602_9BURK|nr:hypothetical protein [Massilia cavernae]RJG22379.1 hypothetical protein D3872_05460 [Massilia cavernae]
MKLQSKLGEPRMQRNIERMQERVRTLSVAFRAHVKTGQDAGLRLPVHKPACRKSPRIAYLLDSAEHYAPAKDNFLPAQDNARQTLPAG